MDCLKTTLELEIMDVRCSLIQADSYGQRYLVLPCTKVKINVYNNIGYINNVNMPAI